MGVFVGILVHKIRVGLIMICGSVVVGIGFLLLATVTELWQFYIFYGLILCIGIARIQLVPNMTAVESWFVQGKSTALGIATAGVGAGGAVMASLAGWLISTYDWQTTFVAMAAIVTLFGVPISAIIIRTPAEAKPVKEPQELSHCRWY